MAISGLCCANCFKREARTRQFKACPCKQVVYCGRSCQKQHHAEHKKVCSLLVAKSVNDEASTEDEVHSQSDIIEHVD